MLKKILAAYGLQEDHCTVTRFGSGLINKTWKISCNNRDYILQRINHQVFHQPELIAANVRFIATFLQQHHPEYLFISPYATTIHQEDLYYDAAEGYFRLFPFIADSHTIDVLHTPGQAYEAARQFGHFTRILSGIDISRLHITLPSFHDLSLRYRQFLEATRQGNPQRIAETGELIGYLKSQQAIVEDFEMITRNPAFKKRVTHHDTKISNVLLDKADKGLCVIDLDTVMPGYFISDVGDMMRTYLSPANEEEKDFSLIQIRKEFFRAILEGYGSEMKDELTATEQQYFVFAGKYMIYMQALRFLTDYLNNDVYYGARYEGHNLVRAGNQVTLLKALVTQETALQQMVTAYFNREKITVPGK